MSAMLEVKDLVVSYGKIKAVGDLEVPDLQHGAHALSSSSSPPM